MSRPFTADPLLSICIPTYNRAGLVTKLVEGLLDVPGPFEICVHDDGSEDETYARLRRLGHHRLHLSSGRNQGRAAALLASFAMATGRFIMPFDDDDILDVHGLLRVLRDCEEPLPAGCVGHIYHLADEDGNQVGADFPVHRSNFLSLRADHGITGDKKEVVLADVLRSVLYDSAGRFRRTPTSLFWSRVALQFDVLCHNAVIGTKAYLPDGMSGRIRRLKVESAYPQLLLKMAVLRGFTRGRYHSTHYASRALAGAALYAALAVHDAVRRSLPWRT